MSTPRQRLSTYLMAASFGLLFAGLSALSGAVGVNEKSGLGVGIGLIAAGLALSLAANQALHLGDDPPRKDRDLE
jgi:hypothetical protein